MEVILKKAVDKLGNEGEHLTVSNGYARNYLIPKGFAIQATKKNIVVLEHEKSLIAKRKKKELRGAEKIANKIRSLSCVLKRQTGEQDKMFGSVTSMDISKFLEEHGIELERKKIQLEEPIKTLGTYRVQINIQSDVTAELKVKIQKEA